MSDRQKESDWKRFRKMVPDLRERYLKEKNSDFVKVLVDPKRTPTDQFWDPWGEMEKEKKILRDCLDAHSRSNQFQHMALMCRYGMLKREDLNSFSDQLREERDRYL